MTDKLPKTIQFFLPQDERETRIADITTRIVQAVLVPRRKLAEAAKREEVKVAATPAETLLRCSLGARRSQLVQEQGFLFHNLEEVA